MAKAVIEKENADNRETCVLTRWDAHGKTLAPWTFEWSETFGRFIHRTYFPTEYHLMIDSNPYKPIWIGRAVKDSVISVESRICARCITFPDGSQFMFPRAMK